MNPRTLKSFDRMLARMERRSSRPPRKFSTAPFVLAAGLVLGEQLLVRFVPMVWETFLPGGLRLANLLQGLPGFIWRVAVLCYHNETLVLGGIGVLSILALALGGRNFGFRMLVWLAAFGVILLDAGIVVVTLMVSYRVTVENLGIPGL